MTRLSVTVITLDEARNIEACLRSVAFADQRVVLDAGSTDGTADLARALGAEVQVAAGWPGFGPQKNRALDLATGDWVLSLDADERLTPELQAEIVATLAAPAFDAYEIPRLSSYCGQPMRHSGWYPDPVLRLFRRGAARFSDDLVHERVLPQGTVGRLRSHLLHDSFHDLESVLDKVNRYSTAGARAGAARGKRATLGKAVGHGLWAFLRTYVFKRGFLDGRMGLVLAISNAEGTYYRYLKLWLMQARPGAEGPGGPRGEGKHGEHGDHAAREP